MTTRSRLLTQGAMIVAVLAAMTLAVRLTLAQAPGPGGDPEAMAPAEVDASVYGGIPVQGRLTGANDHPISGYRWITFSLYASSTGGVPLCYDMNYVGLEDGLFSTYIGECYYAVNGQALYLGIQVEGDPEMTPREPIYPVPYAFTLRPGAVISGARPNSPLLHIETWATTGRGIRVYALAESGTSYGVVGASKSPDGYGGYFYNSGGGTGLRGFTDAADHNYGIYTEDNLSALNYHTSGATMQIVQNGGATALEPGDVVAFSGMGAPLEAGGEPVIHVTAVASANSTAVAGVVHSRYDVDAESNSQDPDTGVTPDGLAGAGDYLLVVVQGPAQVKASAVAGALAPGDLVASAGPAGLAAKAAMVELGGTEIAVPGTVLGKALEPLKEGQGLIHIFVTLQ